MPDPNGPTVRRKRLGSELRRLRELNGLDQTEAGAVLECSKSTMSRIEKGNSKLKAAELLRLLDRYGVTDPAGRQALLDIHRAASKVGWWEEQSIEAALPSGLGVYVGLEADARRLHTFELGYVPGLLQTEDYARAVLSDGGRRSADETQRLVTVRMRRQERITEEADPLQLWAVIDESVLLRPVGGAATMREQLRALVAAAARPNVTIQVYPLNKGVYAGQRGPFTVLEFDAGDPRVVYVDGHGGNLFLEKDDQVEALVDVFNHLRAGALDEADSTALISALAEEE
ncbi:helix-turn-helix transcriptional regulator [Streptomyces sp. NPDC051162]|uniref:helix-turn-helix domain-containing protein n=1 Tax=Streptomyces sp. NPDC051162 TaxID=3154747 RepID=UPI003417BB64